MLIKESFQRFEAHLLKGDQPDCRTRQSGKTTLMMLLREHVQSQGKRATTFNLDIESDRQFFGSQENLLRKLLWNWDKPAGTCSLMKSKKEDAGLFLKGLYDMNLPYKFIVSGSGSLELKEKSTIAGRAKTDL